ncbi:MAG: hypothetical protein Kow006_32060 [Gammaproteobacteria bacterium]
MARLRRRWHRSERPRSAEEVGQALAVSAWKVSRECVENLLAADFDFEGEQYRFAILEEWLAFFIHLTDRIVYERTDDLRRARLIKAMAHRLRDSLVDNATERLDSDAIGAEFIERVNRVGREYAECRVENGEPGMNFLRCLGAGVADAAPEIDRRWLMEQVVEVEAPQAVKQFVSSARQMTEVELA